MGTTLVRSLFQFWTLLVLIKMAQSNVANKCNSKNTCHDCIQTKDCSWCSDPEYDRPERCFNVSGLVDFKGALLIYQISGKNRQKFCEMQFDIYRKSGQPGNSHAEYPTNQERPNEKWKDCTNATTRNETKIRSW
jgi:Integrin plexin domain